MNHTRSLACAVAVCAAFASTGCAETTEDVAPSRFSLTVSPGVAPGLTDGCDEQDVPADRLKGLVYDIPLGTKLLPDFATLKPVGAVCLDRLDVTPRRSVYPAFPGIRDRYRWFAVDLQGTFQVAEAGDFSFRLTSDDGAQVYIDDVLVVDNDGYHPTRMAYADARIEAGRHTLRVEYWQGPGPLALVLDVAKPGEAYHVMRVDEGL